MFAPVKKIVSCVLSGMLNCTQLSCLVKQNCTFVCSVLSICLGEC